MKLKSIPYLTTAFTLFIFWIIYTADTGGTIVFTHWIKVLPYPDKWGHAILYGVLAFLLNITLHYKRVSLGKFKPYLGAVIVMIFAVLEELTQGLLATRSMDYVDVLADLFGVCIFSWVTYRVEKRKPKS